MLHKPAVLLRYGETGKHGLTTGVAAVVTTIQGDLNRADGILHGLVRGNTYIHCDLR